MIRRFVVSTLAFAAAATLAASPADTRALDPSSPQEDGTPRRRHSIQPGGAPFGDVAPSPGRPTTLSQLRDGMITVSEDAENLTLHPFPLHMQTGAPTWSDGSITSVNRWTGTTISGRTAYAVVDPLAGNISKKIRLMATTPLAPNSFAFGFRYELLRTTTPLVRFQLRPGVDMPARAEHDLYVSSLDTLWTSEPIFATGSSIMSRLLWGGTNAEPDIGLPMGPLPHVYVLGVDPSSYLTALFQECRWLDSAPLGETVGAPVVMRMGAWVRVRHDALPSGTVAAALDFNDGTGFHTIHDDTFVTGFSFDAIGGNGSYEVAGSAAYFDNFLGSGVPVIPPTPPLDLVCGPDGYFDNIEWLYAGPLRHQHPYWFDALSSRANVDVVNGDQVIRQTNVFPDDRHREEFTRTLPPVQADFEGSWTLCEEVRFVAGLGSTHQTVRAFAPVSSVENTAVTRLAFGHYDPNRTPAYMGRLFIQHNPAYNPYDDENTTTPYVAGPGGNGGVARIGGAATIGSPNFDYYDTGLSFALNTPQTWCVEVMWSHTMNVTLNGSPIVGAGTGVAFPTFASSVDELRHESENQLSGAGDRLFVDDIFLDCDISVCDCPIPLLTLVYHDGLQWANIGVNIDSYEDEPSGAPFRWTAAPGMPVVALPGKSQVLQMENHYADISQVQGDFTLFNQASTQLPNVLVAPDRGYAAGASFKFTDGLTTRAWMVAEAYTVPGLFNANALILYSAGTGTVWFIRPDPSDPIDNDPIWIDTGRSLASLGVGLNQWFTLTIHHNLDGAFLFKINGAIVTDSDGVIVRVPPLQSDDGGLHNNLDRLYFLSGDDLGVPDGSILYADDIRAWALPCPGDTNDDGVVNFADINNVVGSFNFAVPPGQSPNVAPDADGDGLADDNIVNFADLNAALGQFNIPCD